MIDPEREMWEHDGPWTRTEMRAAIDRVRLSAQEWIDFGASALSVPSEVLMADMLEQVLSGLSEEDR